jgi:hypothetical protein
VVAEIQQPPLGGGGVAARVAARNVQQRHTPEVLLFFAFNKNRVGFFARPTFKKISQCPCCRPW